MIFVVAIGAIIYLNSINFFRLKQGSNGRIQMITYALETTTDRPIVGYGYGMVGEILSKAGFLNSSTHNSLADFAVGFGLPAVIIYIVYIAQSIFRGVKNRKNIGVICAVICLSINMNTVSYVLGGVGIASMLYTILLGLCRVSNDGGSNEKNKYSNSSI